MYYFDEQFHREELLPWYDFHLKGIENEVMKQPTARFYVNGEGEYHSAESWPPPDVRPTTFFLSGQHSGAVTSLNDGSLTAIAPHAAQDSTSWSYPDPKWQAGVTVFDKHGVPDHVARVNTFTSEPMDTDREFTGHGVLTLHASTDQTDMDVFVKVSLVSADPDAGLPIKVTQGWLRASHRAEDSELTSDMRPFHRHAEVQPLTPGEIYELRVELLPMSFLARRGDRIRLEVTNQDSLITDAPMTHFYGQKVGADTYHHDSPHPSTLRLHERPRA
jgi:putative CocE/NonD family hydrolase